MKTKPRAPKKKPVRVTKRPAKPRKKAVSATQARRLAARHVMARMFADVPVRDGADVKRLYRLWREDVWIVFPNREDEHISTLCASRVIVVSKRTGRVLFEGDANDEG